MLCSFNASMIGADVWVVKGRFHMDGEDRGDGDGADRDGKDGMISLRS